MTNKNPQYPQCVTNWHGRLFDTKIRDHVKKGFYVRVIFNQYCIKYTHVLKEMDERKLLVQIGTGNRPERWQSCNICDGPFSSDDLISTNLIYSCNGNDEEEPECDFHCHEKCIKNITKEHKTCDCVLKHVPLSCGDIVVIVRDMISEIHEDDYDEELIKMYKTEKGMFTGITCLNPDIFNIKVEGDNLVFNHHKETTIEDGSGNEEDEEKNEEKEEKNEEKDEDDDVCNKEYFPNILLLCAAGKLEEIQTLFQENPSINFCSHNNYAFRHACANGHLDVAKWLLSICQNIDISSLYYYAFFHACINNHKHIMEWLYEKKEIQSFIEDGHIFISLCEYGSNIEIVKWIYDKFPLEITYETFRITCDYNHHINIKCFLNNKTEKSEKEILCESNKLEIAKWLYSIKPIDFKHDDSYIFENACRWEHFDIAKWIYSIDRGVIHEKKFDIEDNIFIDCCYNKNVDFVEWLLTEYTDFHKSVYKNIKYEDVSMTKWIELLHEDDNEK